MQDSTEAASAVWHKIEADRDTRFWVEAREQRVSVGAHKPVMVAGRVVHHLRLGRSHDSRVWYTLQRSLAFPVHQGSSETGFQSRLAQLSPSPSFYFFWSTDRTAQNHVKTHANLVFDIFFYLFFVFFMVKRAWVSHHRKQSQLISLA